MTQGQQFDALDVAYAPCSEMLRRSLMLMLEMHLCDTWHVMI